MRKLEQIYSDLLNLAPTIDNFQFYTLLDEIRAIISDEDEKKAAKDWKKGTEDIRVSKDKVITAEVFRNKNHPGIMIHRSINRDGKWMSGWNISHEISGLRIGPIYSSMRKAVKAFQEHASGVDWNRSAEELMNDPAAQKADAGLCRATR